MKLSQYSVVKLKEIKKQFVDDDVTVGSRTPKVGDVATIIEIYEKPSLGYELECVGENGYTEWLVTFSPQDAEFELIKENT